MKKSFSIKSSGLVALLGVMLLSGCARRYVLTMQNGVQVSVMGKPKAEGNVYVVKDAQGNAVRIPKLQVREIAPASMASSSHSSGFTSSVSK